MVKDLKSSNTGETINPNIVSENIPSGAVTTPKINDGSVTTDKIANGSVTYEKLATALKNLIDGKASSSDLTIVQNALTSHTSNTSNPHNVTKAQVGLGNVDNTSDANKPISNATQTALDLKADKSNIPFENIKDTQAHNRFIEDNLINRTITGVTQTYSKWSLSGSHLMIVLLFKINSGTTINDYTILAELNAPTWVKNKIYSQAGGETGWVSSINKFASNSNGVDVGNTQKQFLLAKEVGGIFIYQVGGITASEDFYYRVQFDLVIDNE